MTINEIQDRIIREMIEFEDWMDKYDYLISAGRQLKPIDSSLKNDDNLIGGCQSKVWLEAERKNNKVRFFADSEALITKGILSLLLRIMDNQTPDEIKNADLYFIEETGLQSHLSPVRANGLGAIVKQMKNYFD
ncbi:MAG: SufE family protein [Elusimicrobia bacterium]|jgi:cysteine desulfuration protein SufE|nr:SufE family protein [Elusimicrobiota bacterium]